MPAVDRSLPTVVPSQPHHAVLSLVNIWQGAVITALMVIAVFGDVVEDEQSWYFSYDVSVHACMVESVRCII